MSRRPGQILKGSVDQLTGLPSPHAFDQAVGVELEEAYEANQRSLRRSSTSIGFDRQTTSMVLTPVMRWFAASQTNWPRWPSEQQASSGELAETNF
jgi:hypothetical protein